MSKKPRISDELAMLRFCAKHGITANKVTIFQKVKAWDALIASLKRRHSPVSWKPPSQSSLPFGKLTRI